MHQERVAQEHVTSPAGGQHRRAVRGAPGGTHRGLVPGQPAAAGRGQNGGHIEMAAGPDAGRGAVRVCVAEQEDGQQAALPGSDADPPLPIAAEAGLDVPAGVTGIGRTGETGPGSCRPPPPAATTARCQSTGRSTATAAARCPPPRTGRLPGRRSAALARSRSNALSRRTPWDSSPDQMTSRQAAVTAAGTASRTATNPSARKAPISVLVSTGTGSHAAAGAGDRLGAGLHDGVRDDQRRQAGGWLMPRRAPPVRRPDAVAG